MTSTKLAAADSLQTLAMDFLSHHPEPVVFYLPVWSELEADRNLIDFQVGYANRKAGAFFGAVAGQLLSQQAFDPFGHEQALRGILFQHLKTVSTTGENGENSYSLPGSGITFSLQCTGTSGGYLITFRHVNGKAEAVEDAINNAQMLNATANGLLLLEAIRNEQGVVVDFVMRKANRSFADLVEWNDEMIGHSYTLLLPETIELFKLKCRILENGENISYNYCFEGSGKAKWFCISLSKCGEDRLVATFTDITEARKQEEEQRQKLDSRLQTVFDTARAGMYTLIPERNSDGEITDFRFGIVNQAVASYLGIRADELAGSLGSVYFPAYKTNGLFDRYIETMETGNPATFDLHYDDGYDVFFTINVVKMGDELFGTFTDHTQLKRLQRELEASITELKRSNASLEQFAHAASHDLQEPLRRMIVYTEKLLAEHAENIDDTGYGYLERIRTAGKRMHRLVQDLLVFAEVGANKNAVEEVDLCCLVDEVIADLEMAIAERDAIVHKEALCSIRGDSLHLQQLFQNLISNSLKYAKPEVPPVITLSSKTIAGAETALPLGEKERQQAFCCIEVQDNGQGFAPADAEQIFKIFQRLPQHKYEQSGTGIGLAIVQRVVENHRGYITAEGRPGDGATFRVYFPVG